MVRQELIRRSPLRILEKSIRGGLGKGNLAVIASPKGIGKTACLVHIATDGLIQGKHTIHVSFSARTDHIISWYEDIFRGIASKKDMGSAMTVHGEIIRNRVIMNFNQEGVDAGRLVKSLRAMITGGNFAAEQIVIDGYNFRKSGPDDLRLLKDFASETGTSIWLSATTESEETGSPIPGVPEVLTPFIDMISVLITLKDKKNHIDQQLVKDHESYPKENLHVRLDPRTLLIAEDL